MYPPNRTAHLTPSPAIDEMSPFKYLLTMGNNLFSRKLFSESKMIIKIKLINTKKAKIFREKVTLEFKHSPIIKII